MTVSASERLGLSRAVSRLRVLFEDDFAGVLEGTFGIHVSGRRAGEVEDAGALSLSALELAARVELVGVVEYLRGEGLGRVESVERLLRESVFTTVNRLLAVRVAEAVGVLPPSLVDGRDSVGFVEAVEVFPLVRDADPSGGYWLYLQVCGDELSHAVPRLFDRRQPLSVLEPSAEVLDAAVGVLADPELVGVWVEPEALGWSYQFFNTQDERRAMRDASQAPRDSRELAVRNQFFTPSYVVEFLVENTLGRRLRESGSELDLPLLLGEVDDDAPPLDLSDVSVLDPAVGSGHFLLGAYDLLERAWEERGVSPSDAAPLILGSLFGVDIDARAAQVAQSVLYLRARRSAPDASLDPPRVVTARALPKDPMVWDEVLADAPPLVRDMVVGLGEVLELAPVLGSLLKPEEYLREAIGERLETPRLGDDALGSFDDVEGLVLDAAGRISAEAASTPAERLFAADTSDALGFVELMNRRYDTILMNPPFGLAVSTAVSALKTAYPTGWTDLLVGFVQRGWQLGPDSYVGAITSNQFMRNRRQRGFREEMLTEGRVRCVVDLGRGVLQDAAVDVALSVTGPGGVRFYAYLDGTDEEDKADFLAMGSPPTEIDGGSLLSIPGAPMASHIGTDVLALWSDGYTLEPTIAEVCKGQTTFDNFRFLRLWWEVAATGRPDEWPPYSKGGEYQPYVAPPHLLIDWRSDGAALKRFGEPMGRLPQVMQSSKWWGQRGLIYPNISSIGFGVRIHPAGSVFSKDAVAVFPSSEVDPIALLGLLDSTAVASLLTAFGRDRKIEASSVGRLPLSNEMVVDFRRAAREATLEAVSTVLAAERGLEASVYFTAVGSLDTESAVNTVRVERERRIAQLELAQAQVDAVAQSIIFSDEESMPEVESRAQLIGRSYSLRSTGAFDVAGDWLSYLSGCVFGRWDVRVGRDPDLAPALGDPFDPLPVCPPGMLTGDDGLPVVDAPVGYPISLSPDRILHDDPGHVWDVVSRMEAVAEFLFDDPDGEVREALGHVKAKDLRSYLRDKFFSQHLKRYSKSRRKAPIYWYLAVPSKRWGLWVYAPWLSREQLFAVARAAQDKMRRLSDEVSQLRRDVEAGGGRAERERLEDAEVLLGEVAEFYEVADSVAQSGWEPDLNDGIILNAAPLIGLFADAKWRKDVEVQRKKMISGDYPWATVQTTYYDRIQA